MSVHLHIQLFGEFRLTRDDNAPVAGMATPRLQALLTYLLLHRAAPQPRQQMAFLFWPDSTDAQARTNLRHLLHQLHRVLPDAGQFLHADAQTVQWRGGAPFTLDVADFEDAIATATQASSSDAALRALEQAVSLYQGELMPGRYDEWIQPDRERLHHLELDALERLIALLERRQDYRAAIGYAQCLLRLDPLHEAAYRRLMQVYALDGDRAAALRVYHACATTLRRELGVEPSPVTVQSYERLLNLEAQPLPAAPLTNASQLVGRRPAWETLQRAWSKASVGRPALVLVSGEAGIGKSRLAEELVDWAARQGIATARSRCYAAEGRLAYAPISDWLRAETFRATVRSLDAARLTEVARLLPELPAERPDLSPPGPMTEPWQRQRLFEALAHVSLAGGRPLLLLLDDLQWCDPDTLAWLHYLLRLDPRAPLLVLATLRTEEAEVNQPLMALRAQLGYGELLTELALGPLDEEETAVLAAQIAGQALDAALAARLYAETEGNPLFVVETVRAGLDTAEHRHEHRDELERQRSPTAPPPKVQLVIAARLACLSPAARELAGGAATIGRAFRLDVLERASEANEETFVRALDELWQRRIVREQSAGTYDFSHDRIRDAAYAGLSPARRRLLHRRIAQALEAVHANDLDPVSGQLAAHFERAGLVQQAIPYHLKAAQVAHRLSALAETIAHLVRGLELLESLPDTPQRAQQELTFRIALGAPLIAARGYAAPEVEQAFNRALALCRRLGETPQLFQALWGLGRFYLVRPRLAVAVEVGEQLLALARQTKDPDLLLEAHNSLGAFLFHRGELFAGREHIERGIALYDRERHAAHAFVYGQEPGVVCLARAGWALWWLGYPDQAEQRAHEAVALASDVGHGFSLAFALSYAAVLHQFRREPDAAQAWAEQAISLATERGYPLFRALAVFLRGWALAAQGGPDEGIAQMREGLAAFRATGGELGLPYFLTILAETYDATGDPSTGLTLLAEAHTALEREQAEERWCEAELHRLRGDLLLHGDLGEREAEVALFSALAVARRQRARSAELRAATSLSRLRQRQGRHEATREPLATIYAGFTEGLNTSDLLAARALLDALPAPAHKPGANQ